MRLNNFDHLIKYLCNGFISLCSVFVMHAQEPPQQTLVDYMASLETQFDVKFSYRTKDVLNKNPDVVVVWVGVNDVWHKSLMGTGTDYDKFGIFYDAVVKKIQAVGAKVVVVTPAVIGERNDFSNSQDGDLNQYSNWIRKYAAANQLGLVDLRKSFHDYSVANNPENKESGILTYDRVHLNEKGNALVAAEMWKAIQ